MQRNNLITAAGQAARECGLYFHVGYEHQLNEALKETPALWLSHPEAIRQEGIGEGIKTYAVKMFIIGMPDRDGAANPEPVWAQMETQAARICALIAEAQCVKSVSDIEIAAAAKSITNRGEISMAIKMKVHMPFINPKN